MSDAYLPSPDEIAELCARMREEREAGFITKQIKDRNGTRRCVRRQAKKPKPTGNKRGHNDQYMPTRYRLKPQ